MPLNAPKRKYKRLFLAVDLHGSEIVFRKFLGAAKFYEADALLIGGDVTAKTITPIIQQKDGRFRTRLSGQVRENLTQAELQGKWNGPRPYQGACRLLKRNGCAPILK